MTWGHPVRSRLNRIRSALQAGETLDPDDRLYLVNALAAIDAQWPRSTKKAAEDYGRVFARAFEVSGRPGRRGPDRRTMRDEASRIALARAVIGAMTQHGCTYEEACAQVATAHHCSDSTVRRAYRDHRGTIAAFAAVERDTQARAAALKKWSDRIIDQQRALARMLGGVINRR